MRITVTSRLPAARATPASATASSKRTTSSPVPCTSRIGAHTWPIWRKAMAEVAAGPRECHQVRYV